ncbi:unnamed protein product [Cylicostephanus goldi]|uniref:Uncharacterized protein n=1 Tax=Cylicostephanus goldi TaxID=71465 RepID=A0A3P7MNM8_CYLGO|nr:unnamed protein product [Cylicostephanus goldi]
MSTTGIRSLRVLLSRELCYGEYWNVNGGGPSGETPANFDDFRPFAKFTKPTMKQFGQMESICGVTVNR